MSTPSSGGVSVLFVCLGNICRSTMAEGYFRSLTHFNTAQQNPHITLVDSCGTGAYHEGDTPDSRTLAVLRENGIASYTHAARRVRVPEDFQEFDYLLAMDDSNYSDLRDLAERAKRKGLIGEEEVRKVRMLGAFGGKSKKEVIADPYYGGRNGFEKVYEQVVRCCGGLLEEIEGKASV